MKQQTFDWKRSRQLRVLRECKLNSVRLRDGTSVSAFAMKSLLRVIDGRAGHASTCWASIDTMAMEMGCHRRTVQRAMAALRELCLIIESPQRIGSKTVQHRRIVWPNLEDFVPIKETTATGSDTSETSGGGSTAAADHQQPAERIEQPQRHQPAGTPQPSAYQTKATTADGTRTFHGAERRTSTADGFPVVGLNGLADPQLVQRCVDWAQLRGHLPRTEDARLAAFALAARMHRKRKQILNAPGFWKHCIQQGLAAVRGQLDDQHDWPAGRQLLEELQPQPQATG
ncbi:hypothetical protein KOR42_39930 [Thalassoglobus neptunius]|uniref:Helix-turn-helix domain-containing protein n=1 Tax=Thalassoglobus neptunius TaxID=1938619 RepID=A0A5C5WDI8_9PLAN|nr:helix-turn-helix domain-containing protein [Thalassoglobus neptunius]TWT48203.1 hypothetical protein KOR42_39930 [Thalassoglobus neptunius]